MIIDAHKREQIMPLPVAVISTVSKDGVNNLAPWSCISPILRPLEEVMLASWIKRDTLNNIRDTGEFVINIPSVDMLKEVMICAKLFPPEVDEFQKAGLKPQKSVKVKAPGIEGCLARGECVLVEEISREKYSLIIGKVVHLEVRDDCFDQSGDMDIGKAKPLVAVIGEKGTWFTSPGSEGIYFEHKQMSLRRDEK
ncbi:MAG: flavin reductase family protein [Candidatus Contubernalis sp.]|nr:flavin reductase family protein [Candidatus Contubernalis sp.]